MHFTALWHQEFTFCLFILAFTTQQGYKVTTNMLCNAGKKEDNLFIKEHDRRV